MDELFLRKSLAKGGFEEGRRGGRVYLVVRGRVPAGDAGGVGDVLFEAVGAEGAEGDAGGAGEGADGPEDAWWFFFHC